MLFPFGPIWGVATNVLLLMVLLFGTQQGPRVLFDMAAACNGVAAFGT